MGGNFFLKLARYMLIGGSTVYCSLTAKKNKKMYAIIRNDGKFVSNPNNNGCNFVSKRLRNKIYCFKNRNAADSYIQRLNFWWNDIHSFKIAVHPNSRNEKIQLELSF